MPDSSTQLLNSAVPEESFRALARPIIATTTAWILAYTSMFGSTQLVPSIMSELGVGETGAGRILSFENGAFFVAMFLAAGPLARLSRSRTALVGGLLGVIANIASGFATSYDVLMATRIMGGMAFGVMAAAATASAASSAKPGRVFGVASFAMGSGINLQAFVIPYAVAPYGFAGGYFLFAGFFPLLLAPVAWLIFPNHPPGERVSMRTAPNRALALSAMVALFIYEIGQTGVYTFLGTIGANSGLNEIAIGQVLGWTGLVGLSGGLLAIWVGGLRWRTWPVLLGLAANIAAMTGLALCTDETLYEILNFARNTAYWFVVPVMMATLARLDKLGRWAVAVDASWNGGTFAGPMVAGWVIETSGYGGLAGMTLAVGLFALVVIAIVVRRIAALPHHD